MKEKNPSNGTGGKGYSFTVHYFESPFTIELDGIVFPKGTDCDTGSLKVGSRDPECRRKRPVFYEALANIKGLKSAGLFGKRLQIEREIDAPKWETLLPQIAKAVKEHILRI